MSREGEDTSNMLSVYESMRRLIIGGGKGWTASQLGARGTHKVLYLNTKKYKINVFLLLYFSLNAMSGSANCQHSVMEVGNFYDVIARREALRDPLLTDTHPSDEDTPKDFLNRKTEVHLGNRFKGGNSLGDIGAWRSRQTAE